VVADTALVRKTVLVPTSADDRSPSIAATVIAPREGAGPRTLCFAFPGGGYSRHYFDLRHLELSGPSQAEFHAAAGIVFVAFDPYGGGESTPLPPDRLGLDATADACHFATEAAIARLRKGDLVPGLSPLEVSLSIGIGHSLGGMQVIAQQARNASFNAVAILGWSAVHTIVPTRDGVLAPHAEAPVASAGDLAAAWAGPLVDEMANLRYAYHWEDVSAVLVQEDMTVGFPTRTARVLPAWITETFPPFASVCLTEGIVSTEAARIRVPVFVGAGERDVMADIRREPAAYAASRDITVFQVPRMAHMHNFSPQRRLLWARLQRWIDGLHASQGDSPQIPYDQNLVSS
jgi:Alpha/beta hydrolase family